MTTMHFLAASMFLIVNQLGDMKAASQHFADHSSPAEIWAASGDELEEWECRGECTSVFGDPSQIKRIGNWVPVDVSLSGNSRLICLGSDGAVRTFPLDEQMKVETAWLPKEAAGIRLADGLGRVIVKWSRRKDILDFGAFSVWDVADDVLASKIAVANVEQFDVSHLPNPHRIVLSVPFPLNGRPRNVGVIDPGARRDIGEASTRLLKVRNDGLLETLISASTDSDGAITLATIALSSSTEAFREIRYFTRCFANDTDGAVVELWNTDTRGENRHSIAIGLSPGAYTCAIAILDGATAGRIAIIESLTGRVRTVVSAPIDLSIERALNSGIIDDGRLLMINGRDKLAAVSLPEGRYLGTLPGSRGRVQACSIKEDRVVACYKDGTIRHWRAQGSIGSNQSAFLAGRNWFVEFDQIGRRPFFAQSLLVGHPRFAARAIGGDSHWSAFKKEASEVLRLVSQLDDESGERRQFAIESLKRLGMRSRWALTARVRDRGLPINGSLIAEKILREVGREPCEVAFVKELRAIEVLELASSPATRKLLRVLKDEIPGHPVTVAAKNALQRVEQREARKDPNMTGGAVAYFRSVP